MRGECGPPAHARGQSHAQRRAGQQYHGNTGQRATRRPGISGTSRPLSRPHGAFALVQPGDGPVPEKI
jgi:hypothetical protein